MASGTNSNKLAHLLNERDVAEMLGVSVATTRRWRLLRQGPKFIKLGSSVRYHPNDLNEWIDARPTGGESGLVK